MNITPKWRERGLHPMTEEGEWDLLDGIIHGGILERGSQNMEIEAAVIRHT